MKLESSIQFFHTYTNAINIIINNKDSIYHLQPNTLSNQKELLPNIYEIQVLNIDSNEILYVGKLPILNNQELIIFILPYQCISVMKNTLITKDEASLRFLNLSNKYTNLHLSVTNGDNLFEDITFKQISEPLAIFPMSLFLEIRNSLKIIKKLTSIQFKANCAYIIVILNDTLDVHILDYTNNETSHKNNFWIQ